MPEAVPAVVLAGGTRPEVMARHYGLAHKALVPVAGVPLVQRVMAALQAARQAEPVALATCREEVAALAPPGVIVARPSGTHFVDTITAGLAAVSRPERILVCTCDLPLLTPEAVDDFVGRALDTGADLCYSMVNGQRLRELPVLAHRTLVRLREGRYTGGNLALLSRRLIEEKAPRLGQAFAGRKNQLALAWMLGPGFVWRLATGRLGLAEIVAKARELLDLSAAVIDSTYVEVCYDIDKPRHVALAEAILAQR